MNKRVKTTFVLILIIFLIIMMSFSFLKGHWNDGSSFLLEEATIHSVHDAIKQGEISCEQLTNLYIDRIKKYKSDNEKQVLRTLSPTDALIEIYKKNGWIKVGDPKDGTVGWINQKQYQKAIDHFNTPNIKEIFISRTRDETGKPEIRVVAYQNGEKVSDEKARAIYEKIKKQQALQEQYWRNFNKQITHWQKTMLNNFYHDEFFNQLIWMPAPIVVVKSEDGKTK